MYLSVVVVVDSQRLEPERFVQEVYGTVEELEADTPKEMHVEIVRRVKRFLDTGSMQSPNRVTSISHTLSDLGQIT